MCRPPNFHYSEILTKLLFVFGFNIQKLFNESIRTIHERSVVIWAIKQMERLDSG